MIIWTLAPVELVSWDDYCTLDKLIIWTLAFCWISIWDDYCTLDKLIIWTLDSVESVHGTIIVL